MNLWTTYEQNPWTRPSHGTVRVFDLSAGDSTAVQHVNLTIDGSVILVGGLQNLEDKTMERYVDGYVLPVPTDKVDEYREMASEGGRIWMEHGALAYFEGVGDDLDPDMGGMEVVTFPELLATGPDETVIFAFVVYESREHRDEVNAAVMDDPAMNDPERADEPMPFDMERMAYGGFRSIVNHEK